MDKKGLILKGCSLALLVADFILSMKKENYEYGNLKKEIKQEIINDLVEKKLD